MNKVEINKTMKLSEHLASPSEAALSQTNELDGLRLSPHFTLEELCKTSYHTLDGNIPSRVAIENLKRICEGWLEDLRFSYNELYGDRREGGLGFAACYRRDARTSFSLGFAAWLVQELLFNFLSSIAIPRIITISEILQPILTDVLQILNRHMTWDIPIRRVITRFAELSERKVRR